MMKPLLLVLVFLSEAHRELIAQHFDVLYAPSAGGYADRANGQAQIDARGDQIRVVLTNGVYGLLASEIDQLPKVELICTVGVGYEMVAVAHARERGIALANAAGTNDECVADHAMTLLLAALRRLPFLNAGVRHGMWRDDIPRPPHVSGRRMGIIGLGAIGSKIADRASAFRMEIGYHNRKPRPGCAHRYFESPLMLAEWCDTLVLAAPGGPETFHLVDAPMLEALGPGGVLVNIARGSLVDTSALADALRHGRLLAAALDVYESEPRPPEALLGFDNVILTPHVGGISPEAIHASVLRFLENASLHFNGQPLATPIG